MPYLIFTAYNCIKISRENIQGGFQCYLNDVKKSKELGSDANVKLNSCIYLCLMETVSNTAQQLFFLFAR